jgi:hypothetical protein
LKSLDQKATSPADGRVIDMGNRRYFAPAISIGGALLVTILSTQLVVSLEPFQAIALITATPVAALAFFKSWARLSIVVGGALLVFQSTADSLKFGYFFLAILCVIVSAIRLLKRPTVVNTIFRPLQLGSALLIGYIGVTWLVASSNGATFSDWFKDVLPYILMALLPTVGLDAARDMAPRNVEGLIGVLGVACAVAVAVDWMGRRGISSLGFGRIILSTIAVVSLAFALGVTRAGLGPKRTLWIIGVTVMGVAMLLSGSRTNLVLFIAILAVVGSAKQARVRLGRMVINSVFAVFATAVLLVSVGSIVIQDPRFLPSRVQSVLMILNGGASGDLSFVERSRSYDWTWSAFQNHLTWGTGPGYLYPNGVFGLDAATLVLAKWGIVGTCILIVFLWTFVASVVKACRLTGPLPIYTAAGGWLVVLVALLPFGPWIEDKGFSLALTLLTTAVAGSVHVSSVSRPITIALPRARESLNMSVNGGGEP